MEKLEILEDIIYSSKEFEFKGEECMRIRKYYDTSKYVYIDFMQLIETLREKCNDDEINKILLNEEEFEGREEW